jgi:hypothetical protein
MSTNEFTPEDQEVIEKLRKTALEAEANFTKNIVDSMQNAISSGMPLHLIHTHLSIFANQTLGYIMTMDSSNKKGH